MFGGGTLAMFPPRISTGDGGPGTFSFGSPPPPPLSFAALPLWVTRKWPTSFSEKPHLRRNVNNNKKFPSFPPELISYKHQVNRSTSTCTAASQRALGYE